MKWSAKKYGHKENEGHEIQQENWEFYYTHQVDYICLKIFVVYHQNTPWNFSYIIIMKVVYVCQYHSNKYVLPYIFCFI